MSSVDSTACVLGCVTRSGDPIRAMDGHMVCDRCATRLDQWLNDREHSSIPALYAQLDTVLLPGSVDGSRGSPGYGSRSPARDHVIALRDRRNPAALDPGDIPSVLGVLEGWTRLLREERGLTVPAGRVTVMGEARTLRFHLDWITRQPWVDELHGELREVRDQLRAALGEHRPRPVGPCPNTVDEERCGSPLYAPRYGDAIHCRACGRCWERREWMMLGRLLEDAS